MSGREKKFRQLLKDNGVTKCYIGDGFSFDDEYPNGIILIDKDNSDLVLSLFKLFTEDIDGFVGEDQSLFIGYNDFEKYYKENYFLGD